VRRFNAPSLPRAGGEVALEPEVAHHLLDVVRITRGEHVVLFDGRGMEVRAVLRDVAAGVPVLVTVEDPRSARPEAPLHLLLAVLKGPSMDEAVRMATEAGMTDLHPVLTARSVAKGERGDRWERIARSAAQQSGRGDVPALHPLRSLDEALAALPEGLERRIALPGAPRLGPAAGAAAVLVGPEGGLTSAEVARATAARFQPFGLGRWVLRAETAAAVACAATAADR
jgi:16S rRNA (uracil1498-N3)-methyltransferase